MDEKVMYSNKVIGRYVDSVESAKRVLRAACEINLKNCGREVDIPEEAQRVYIPQQDRYVEVDKAYWNESHTAVKYHVISENDEPCDKYEILDGIDNGKVLGSVDWDSYF